MREEANPCDAWADCPAVWITLCSVMLFLLLNRWAEATASSLSASETSLPVLPKADMLLRREKWNISQLRAHTCLVLNLAFSGFSRWHLHRYMSL